jgi:hypothetical protein
MRQINNILLMFFYDAWVHDDGALTCYKTVTYIAKKFLVDDCFLTVSSLLLFRMLPNVAFKLNRK